MKILLDENLDPKLIPLLSSNSVKIEPKTVNEMGWLGIKNGKLLQLAADNNFDIFVSMDKNIRYQQNIDKLNMIIIILRAFDNKFSTVSNLIPKLISEIEEGNFKSKGSFIEIS